MFKPLCSLALVMFIPAVSYAQKQATQLAPIVVGKEHRVHKVACDDGYCSLGLAEQACIQAQTAEVEKVGDVPEYNAARYLTFSFYSEIPKRYGNLIQIFSSYQSDNHVEFSDDLRMGMGTSLSVQLKANGECRIASAAQIRANYFLGWPGNEKN